MWAKTDPLLTQQKVSVTLDCTNAKHAHMLSLCRIFVCKFPRTLTQPACSAEGSNWENQSLRPELTYGNVMSPCGPDRVGLHRSVVRDTADPTVRILLVLHSAAQQAYKGGLVLMQQKAMENIKHICKRKTPTGGQRQTPLLCVCVCVCMCTVCIYSINVLLATVRNFNARILRATLDPGVPVWAPQRVWLFPLDNQRVKVLIRHSINFARLQLPSYGPLCVREQILRAQNWFDCRGCVEGRRHGVGLARSFAFAGGESDNPLPPPPP